MTAFRVLLSRIGGLVGGRRRDRDLSEEIDAHLEELTAEHVRQGLSREDARDAARRAFGGVDQMKERYRDQRELPFVDALVQDMTFAIRTFRRTPSSTAICVLTLALGIGASTAAFSVFNALVLRPLPVFDPDGLVLLQPQRRGQSRGGATRIVTAPPHGCRPAPSHDCADLEHRSRIPAGACGAARGA